MITVHACYARCNNVDYVLQEIPFSVYESLMDELLQSGVTSIRAMPAYYAVSSNRIYLYPQKSKSVTVHTIYTSDNPNETLRPP